MDDELPMEVARDFVLRWRLSARASAAVAKVASGYQSDIELGHAGTTINAKSIMGILVLAHGAGSENVIAKSGGIYLKAGLGISIMARGPDATEAVTAIVKVLSEPDLDYD
jgi:phosphocarrier protein HPr